MLDAVLERKLEIQKELKRRGVSQAAVAREAGVSSPTVTDILNGQYSTVTEVGRATQMRVLRIIAKKIRTRPDLFPELQKQVA